MTSLKTIAIAALLSAVTTTPLLAQAAVSEPGAFSFYHPNADVLNPGAPRPSTGLGVQAPAPYQAYAAVPNGVRYSRHHRARR